MLQTPTRGFLNAVTAAVNDSSVTLISISWGAPEVDWTTSVMTSFDQEFQAAGVLGKTVFVASGDNGSSDGASGNNVDFPASSPHAVGCGGTTLTASGDAITSEVVWNSDGGASGGGVSNVFPKPSYQANANVPTPTVSAAAGAFPMWPGTPIPIPGTTWLSTGRVRYSVEPVVWLRCMPVYLRGSIPH